MQLKFSIEYVYLKRILSNQSEAVSELSGVFLCNHIKTAELLHFNQIISIYKSVLLATVFTKPRSLSEGFHLRECCQ